MNVPRERIVVAPLPIAISDEQRLGYEKIMTESPGIWRQTPKALAPDAPTPPTPPAQPTPPRDDGPKPQEPTWPDPPEPEPERPDSPRPDHVPKKPKK